MTTLLAALALSLPQMPAAALDAWAAPAGLQVVRLHVAAGDVVVYLPARIGAGDLVSGSVYTEAAGESRVEQANNAAALAKLSVEVAGVSTGLDKSQFAATAPGDGSPIMVTLKGDGADVRGSTSNIALGASIDEPTACPVVEVGTAIRVVGKFDGNRESTMAWIDGVPAGIVAEGSRDCVVSTMNAGVGAHRLRIKEGGVESEHMVNVVQIDVKAPMDARVGKKTAIEVVVEGLEDADAGAYPLKVTLSNNMPALFPFGDVSELSIARDEVKNGRWTGKVEFKPKKKGQYAMSARLVCDAFLKRLGI